MLVAFFDIGGTLGSPRFSPPPCRLEGLNVYPYAPGVLEKLRDNDVRIGIISITVEETAEETKTVLEACGLYRFFEPHLLVYGSVVGLQKNSPEIFEVAAARAGHSTTPEKCLFVGEDREQRGYALEAGFRVAPHPCLALEVLNGSRLRYIRATVPVDRSEEGWRRVMRDLPLVPLHVTGDKGREVYAIATTSAASRLDDLGFEVDRLGGESDPLATDMYLLRDDRRSGAGFLTAERQSARFLDSDGESKWILSSAQEGLYIALPAGCSVEEYHFDEGYHGHTLKLSPDISLLNPFGADNNTRTASWLHTSIVQASLSGDELEKLREITPQLISGYLERYTGVKPLDDEGDIKIRSRHIHHPDNTLTTEMLARDLDEVGRGDFSINIHQFVHEGRTLANVEAELRGDESNEIVLITAHLDSTAAFSEGPYNPEKDPAPGADDDGSGLAAVLAVASAIKKMAGVKKPRRTIRFALFNAEEHGLVGSRAYARDQAALEAPIVAVYQMDMLGYNKKPPRSFEVHVGYPASTDVQARSLTLARQIDGITKRVSPDLEQPQIYRDRDPAAGRSDHASFQERGYAACAVSEDFFVGPEPDSPEPEQNPNYHKRSDTFVDPIYAADMARVVGAAAWLTANA